MAEELAGTSPLNAIAQPRVLIADPAQSAGSPLVERLVTYGYDVLLATNLESAAGHIRSSSIGYCVTEIKFDDGTVGELLRLLSSYQPDCRTIVHSAYCNVATAVSATRAGAADVLPKPMAADFLLAILLQQDMPDLDGMACVQCPKVVREEHIRQMLHSYGSNVSRTADRLLMHRRTLQRMLAKTPELRT